MLFEPDLNLNLIKDKDFPKKILQIEETLKACRIKGIFKTFDSLEIYYEYYLAENSRASVVIVHGFTEFCKKYRETAYYFLNMGYNVFLYDQRGHGLSGRRVDNLHLTHVESYDYYVKDLDCFIENVVRPNSGGKEIYIFSHSMGGAVTALYLMKNQDIVKKAVLSSPLVAPKTHKVPSFLIKNQIEKSVKEAGWDAKFRYASSFVADYKIKERPNVSINRLKYYHSLRVKEHRYQNSSSTNSWMYKTLLLKNQLLSPTEVSKIKADTLVLLSGMDGTIKHLSQKRFEKLIPNHKTIIFKNSEHSIYTACDKELETYYRVIFQFLED